MNNFLFEEDKISPKSRKKKSEEETPTPEQVRKMIDVKVGDFSAEIPESALSTVVAFIRELLKADMNTDDVINLLMTQIENDGRHSNDKIALIRGILGAIGKKYGPDFINKVPATFPFLAAEDADSYPLSELDADSITLLNYGKDRIGRGEAAIPLLFGIDKFAADDDPDEGKGTKSYDLVYKGQAADIKDYRNLVGGKLVDQGLLRIGGPSSSNVISEGNVLFKENSIDFLHNLKVEDFTGFAAGSEAVINAFKNALTELSAKKLALMTKADIKKELDDGVAAITEVLDSAVQNVITEKYPGGFFTIDESNISIVPGSGFEFYACKADKRVVIAPVSARKFKNGLKGNVTKKTDEVIKFLEKKTGKPVEEGTIADLTANQPDEQETSQQQPAQQDIAESLLRSLIRSL